MNIDLHTHTTASDGVLSPSELLQRAELKGVDVLAITDHDSVDGVVEACGLCRRQSTPYTGKLIIGVELTVLWEATVIHLLGLSISPEHSKLLELIGAQRAARKERASLILSRLEKAGLSGMKAMLDQFDEEALLTRPHIARRMVSLGHTKDESTAFKCWLGRGKPGDVPCQWVSLKEGIEAIHSAGGIAVLAHPDQYRLSTTKQGLLAAAFAEQGGDAVELVCGNRRIANDKYWLRLINKFGLHVSCGSDFHDPAQLWREIGCVAALPAGVQPVWQHARFA